MDQPAPLRVLFLTVSGQRYALPLDVIREVFDSQAAVPVPLAPPAITGVIDVRGRILPVVDVALLLQASAALEAGQVVLAAAPDGGADVGLQVDDVPGLGIAQRTLSPRARLPRFVSHLLDTADGAVPLLDLAALIEAGLSQDNSAS